MSENVRPQSMQRITTADLANAFINDQISKVSWLTRFGPKQMSIYHKAIDQTRQQLLGL